MWAVHLPFLGHEHVGGYITKSVMHGQSIVTFPATEHNRPLAGTKLYCMVTEAHRHRCE